MTPCISVSLRLRISAACVFFLAAAAIPAAVTETVSDGADSAVIVIMRDQLDSVPPLRRAMSARASAVAASQSSVVAGLQRTRVRSVISFSTINAFATRVSAAEAAELATHPLVQAVVPDRVIHIQKRAPSGQSAYGVAASASPSNVAAAGAPAANAGASSVDPLCGTLEPEALQLTNAAFLNSSTAQAQEVLDGNGQPVTGKGVKVAFIADGLDPNIAGFIRPDGSHVFIDYQNFNGDPAGTATGGAEAFGDASSIAAQDYPHGKLLTFDIAKFVNPAHPLPPNCLIHIRGMAPGASLVGLNVFSELGSSPTSNFVQAIDYAVSHDDVDIINESFGSNPYPDTSNDPISLANAAAVKAGVTVTVSSGDAGSMGTIESPSTLPSVIAVGATTQLRLYAQIGYYVQSLAKGYVDDNISAFSSGGVAQNTPRTVDVVAPGDSGWALCSTNSALFADCLDDTSATGGPTPIEDFGGTSEAAPLTAGEAALVIQAYRSTHGGKDPSPALVKEIIMSSATDLGAPTTEQGAGLINALGAVNLALSINDGNGRPKSHGHGLLAATTSIGITGYPNTHESQVFKITNTGSTSRHIEPMLQTLGAPFASATENVRLDPASNPVFLNSVGASRSYVKQKFTVPAGAQHLDAAIAFQGSLPSLLSANSPYVYLALLDPAGRQVQYSEPQQSPPSSPGSGYGHVDVVTPTPGVWTAIIFTRTTGNGSYTGPVVFNWAVERFVSMGSIHPAKLDLAPGETASFTADFFTPSEPGDMAAGVRFTESDGSYTLPELPVVLRTLVPTGPYGGIFSGTLTGGNGRPGSGNEQTFEFDVPAGIRDMSVVVPIADSGYLLTGVLVDPQGMMLSNAINLDPTGAPQYALQHFRFDPQPGRWKYLLIQTLASSGNQTSLPFTARIGFNNSQITVTGLPNSPAKKLSASGKPVTATIDVTNTGAVTTAYFADARLAKTELVALPEGAFTALCPAATLPGACGLVTVPSEASSVKFSAKSTTSIDMDAFDYSGYAFGSDPDLFAVKTAAHTVVASLEEPEIPYGPWVISPSLVGPYGASGAPTKAVTLSATAVMRPFDTAISADSGDAWADLTLGTNTYNPLYIAPGEAGTITLTITPDPSLVGKTVSGYVFIDTYSQFTATGDEVVRIPYSYTVAP